MTGWRSASSASADGAADHVGRWSRMKAARGRPVRREPGQPGTRPGDAARDGSPKAKEFRDMRDMFADGEIDAVAMTTPNHWHSLSTIWACKAGKDVYCEKPACHNPYEGWKAIDVVRRTGRIVQIGSQGRSAPHKIEAIGLIKEGLIGELYMAKGHCFKRRPSIGHTPIEPVPPGIDWDLFLGPARRSRSARTNMPTTGIGSGTPGTGTSATRGSTKWTWRAGGWANCRCRRRFTRGGGKYHLRRRPADAEYADGHIRLRRPADSVRDAGAVHAAGGWTAGEAGGNTIGDIYFGSDGWMWLDNAGCQVYKGEKSEKVMDKPRGSEDDGTEAHMENFLAAVRSRNPGDLHAPIEIGVTSANLCHIREYQLPRRPEADARRAGPELCQRLGSEPDADAGVSGTVRSVKRIPGCCQVLGTYPPASDSSAA